MRIIHVIASLAASTGGPAKAAIEMARATARLGHDVAVYATDRGLGPDERPPLGRAIVENGVELRYFGQHFPAALAASRTLYRGLAEAIPDVDAVHLHSLYLFHDWATAKLCRRFGKPYLLRPHGTLDPYIWKRHRLRKRAIELLFQDRVTRGAAALHFTAEDEMTLAAPHAFGRPGVVVPLGLDMGEFAAMPQSGEFRARHPEIGTRPIVLFLSRLNFKKGLDLLVPAFRRAVDAGHDLHLAIAGPDEGMGSSVERWIDEYGVRERTTRVGMLRGRDKLAAYADAAMFALPSYSENFGLVVAEAMAAGLPVAISDKVNIWREVEAAGAGLVAPTDIAAVAAQIAQLAADPAAARALGERGRRLVAERFAWPNIAERLVAVYRSLALGQIP